MGTKLISYIYIVYYDKINWWFIRFHIIITFLREYVLFRIITIFWKNVFVNISEKKVVAYDARLTNDVNNLATNGRVIFGTVGLNEGNGYDPSTGIFTAPTEGIYVFDWTTLIQQGKYANTSLVVNGKIKSWNHCYDVTSKIYLACSKMTVVKLKRGDKVWIGVFSGKTSIYAKYTSFSGYKL